MLSFRTTSIISLCLAALPNAAAQDATRDDAMVGNYWSRHHQRVLDAYVTPDRDSARSNRSAGFERSMSDAEATLREVQVGNVHERMRDLLSEANDRYWQRRFETDTIPGDAWTPQ